MSACRSPCVLCDCGHVSFLQRMWVNKFPEWESSRDPNQSIPGYAFKITLSSNSALIYVPFLIYLWEKSLEDNREAVLAVAKVRSKETNMPLPPKRVKLKLMFFPDSEANMFCISWFNFSCENYNVIFLNQNLLHISTRQTMFKGPGKKQT